MWNKKAQVSDAMSWMVATLVIISLLSISVYAASLMSETKIVGYSENDREEDLVMVNSILSYFALSNEDLRSGILSSMKDREYYDNFGVEFNKINRVLSG